VSLKLEAGIVGSAALTLIAFLTFMMTKQDAARADPVDHFIQADYEAFDRNFEIAGTGCDIGLAAHQICMHRSPMERDIARG
jgi:hypothetical protein